ncbi:MAG: alpha/beta hydrolase [Bacteroidia bacterium]
MKKIVIMLFSLCLFHFAHAQIIDTLIDVGGYKLHFTIIKGNGTPILFEAGNGADGSDWQPILEDIHKATGATLITYDRAGLGKSEIDTTTISFKIEIVNLEDVLKTLGYTKKIFLVAHSFGGFYASLFSYRNQSEVKGAVFIDVGVPCMVTKEWAENYKKSVTKEDWQMIKKYKLGLYYILQNFPEIADYMADKYISNTIPLTLIVAENLPDSTSLKTENDRKNWVNCLREFGNLPHHKYVLAQGADHKVWIKNPKIVVEEITKMYNYK